ncbi:MAG: hypothetical protein ABJ388_01565 [Alphaproteobacteria bacterium]|uniref:hypothetical protein n=1 Tax=Nisaea sp. TaxID=2024842 RepID=UPI003263A1E0
MVQLSDILTIEDIEIERSARDLISWWEHKNNQISDDDDLRKVARLKQGLAKEFYEEIYPLSLLAAKKFTENPRARFRPVIGNQRFDAVIRDICCGTSTEILIEFTSAIDGYTDSLRMEYMNEHGHVPATGHVQVAGTKKTGRNLDITLSAVCRDDEVSKTLDWIGKAAEKKLNKPYEPNTWIVVVFDDHIGFSQEDSRERVLHYVANDIVPLKWKTEKLVVLGTSGRTFFEFNTRLRN